MKPKTVTHNQKAPLVFLTGLKNIQEWTKRSLQQKPFATAKGKIWTLTPSYMALEQIYTQLSLVRKKRGIGVINKLPLGHITQLFSEETTDEPCSRILITGRLLVLQYTGTKLPCSVVNNLMQQLIQMNLNTKAQTIPSKQGDINIPFMLDLFGTMLYLLENSGGTIFGKMVGEKGQDIGLC